MTIALTESDFRQGSQAGRLSVMLRSVADASTIPRSSGCPIDHKDILHTIRVPEDRIACPGVMAQW